MKLPHHIKVVKTVTGISRTILGLHKLQSTCYKKSELSFMTTIDHSPFLNENKPATSHPGL
jgi:hypothetical protein